MLSQTLKQKVNNLWDKFWAGGISNPLTAIEQISYLLFMRRIDEQDTDRKRKAEFTGEQYQSIFEGKEDLRWSYLRQITDPVKKLEHVRDKVFPFIKELNGASQPFTRHMKNAVFIIPKPSLLDEAITKIDEIYEEIEKSN